jgi:hypothetical protein
MLAFSDAILPAVPTPIAESAKAIFPRFTSGFMIEDDCCGGHRCIRLLYRRSKNFAKESRANETSMS